MKKHWFMAGLSGALLGLTLPALAQSNHTSMQLAARPRFEPGSGPNQALNLELLEAISKGNRQQVRSLLSRGANPNTWFIHEDYSSGHSQPVYDETTALGEALGYNHIAIVKILIEAGADPNLGQYRPSAMQYAVQSGNLELLRYFLAHGGDAKGFPKVMAQPDSEVAKLLLAHGADPSEGLFIAVNQKDTALVKRLFALGAKLSREPDALRQAIELKDEALINILLSRPETGPDYRKLMTNSLELTLENNLPHLLGSLLESGADPTQVPNLLWIAIDQADFSLLQRLLAYGLKPDGQSKSMRPGSMLEWGVMTNDLRFVRALHEAGARVEKDALMQWAAMGKDPAMVEYLLGLGATIRNENCPICNAGYSGSIEVAASLLDHGAVLTDSLPATKLRPERTALSEAFANWRFVMIDFLLSRGAQIGPREQDLIYALTQASDALKDDPALEGKGASAQAWPQRRPLYERLIRSAQAQGLDINALGPIQSDFDESNPAQIQVLPVRRTPLHEAILEDQPAFVSLLLSCGADPHQLDTRRRNALDYARELKRPEIEAMLMPYFSEKSAPTQSGIQSK